MSVNLVKGQKISLTKENLGLQAVMVGLGWDEVKQSGGLFGIFSGKKQDIDCDASVLLCDANEKVISRRVEDYCIYFGNLRSRNDAVIHHGDNLTGGGEGDDEQITVNLEKLPPEVEHLIFCVNIYDAKARGQHFGMIENAFIRLVDMRNNKEICRYNLSENYYGMTGLIVGEIYRNGTEWKFNAIGQPLAEASRLGSIIQMYQ